MYRTSTARHTSKCVKNVLKGKSMKHKPVTIGEEYCPLCGIALATHDPEKVTRGGVNYHNACLKKTNQPIRRSVQTRFRLEQGLYVQ